MKTLKFIEVARYLGISKHTLYKMLKDGRFTVEPIKGLEPRRWNVEDIDAWRFTNATTIRTN